MKGFVGRADLLCKERILVSAIAEQEGITISVPGMVRRSGFIEQRHPSPGYAVTVTPQSPLIPRSAESPAPAAPGPWPPLPIVRCATAAV